MEVVLEIVRQNPGINKKDIKAAAKRHEIAKGRVDKLLERTDAFRWVGGKGTTHHYYLAEEPTATQTVEAINNEEDWG